MNYRLSHYVISADITKGAQQEPYKILFSTRTSSRILVKDELYQKVKRKEFDDIDWKTINKLFQHEILVPAQEDEFKHIIEHNKFRLKEAKSMETTIQPTANCQLGCHYCGQVHSKKTMTKEMSDKVLARLTKLIDKKPLERLMVTWYGGEPLMAYSRIKEMSEELMNICQSRNIYYTAMMITNGLSLKKKIFEDLVLKSRIYSYQITVDTMPEHHDQRRITKKGEKTFDIIFKNILEVVNSEVYEKEDCSIILRMNIDSTNYQSVPDFIDLLAEHKLQKKVSIVFAPIVKWGDNDADEYALSKEDFGEMEINWILKAIQLGFKLDEIIPDRTYMPCMVVKDDWEVYDAFGNIYPCYEFSYTPYYETEKHQIGNLSLPEETYNMKAEPRNWYEDVQTNFTDCPTCALFPVCGGGCPKNWYIGDQKGCPSYKFNIEDLLVLEYLSNKTTITELI